MRTKRATLLSALLLLGLLLPVGASATPLTVIGSLTITKADGTPLTTELVGFAVIANPGFEKTITQQIPPFTVPFFVDVDKEDSSGSSGEKILKSRFDTTVVLTNTTPDSLNIKLTLRDDSGALLTTEERTLDANATIVIVLSELLL
ncbi:MAG: hypothetical protein ACK4Z6_03815 [Candidatus Methylomirabilales bacterium]